MWTRRKLFQTAAVGATGLALAPRRATAQAAAGGEHQHQAMWTTCCDTCGECAKACNKAFHHSMTQAAAGKAQYLRMAQTAVDCAEFCALSAEMMARSSKLAMLSCHACAEACKRCAQECEAFDTDLELKVCSQECQRCEESCRKMVGGGEANQPAAATARPKAN